MDLALAQHHVTDGMNLDLRTVLRVVQHTVTHLDRAHALPDADHLSPHEPTAHARGGGDHDSAGRPPLALGALGLHEDPVVQQFDGQPGVARYRHGRNLPEGRRPRAPT
jgi:hypothetical protein